MLDPTQLETFLTVAQTQNFTEAGRRLGLKQSTVSQHIRKLEAGRRPRACSSAIRTRWCSPPTVRR